MRNHFLTWYLAVDDELVLISLEERLRSQLTVACGHISFIPRVSSDFGFQTLVFIMRADELGVSTIAPLTTGCQ